MSKELLNRIRDYVNPMYQSDKLKYHNLTHIEQVLNAIKKIGKKEGLSKESILDLKIAALFHDVGYLKNPETHEEISAGIAEVYLGNQELLDGPRIDRIKQLILATRISIEPKNIEEMIMRDADVAHVGSVDFIVLSEGLRQEMKILLGVENNLDQWQNQNLEFLNSHHFYTSSAREMFEKQKLKNIKSLSLYQKTKDKENKKLTPDRGIETMFRVALRNHNQLSQIADNKANIMLSVSTIMFSLILTSLIPKVDSNPILLIPTIITVLVSLITMYFAVMATRPNVNVVSNYSRDRLLQNKTNILFFGNFQDLELDEFEWGIGQLMADKDLLYGALTKDLFYLGKVLSKKYKFLQKCYSVFMIGLIISAMSYIVALLL